MQKLIDLSQKQNELNALVEEQKLKLAKQQKLLDKGVERYQNKMKDIIGMFLKMQDSIELMFEEHFQGNFQINFSWDQRICQMALLVCIVSREKNL